MLDQPRIMRLAHEMAQHAAFRQGIVAQNMANADTPGYRARDVAAFRAGLGEVADPMRQTRRTHLGPMQGTNTPEILFVAGIEASPNGNTVLLETEMVRAAAARSQHDRALSVYKAALDMMRTALGRGR
ncbi:MAG: FlgB family protein [Pseudomonadota bacterium]